MTKRLFALLIINFIATICIFAQDTISSITQEEKQWLINKTKESLVFVEGGSFMMGDVGYTDSAGVFQRFGGGRSALPVHEVTLDSYSIQKYEVTFKEFDLFTKATGQELVNKKYRELPNSSIEMSAKGMNWYQAKEYCQWVGNLSGLDMTLPTDAQWEYAARSRGEAVKYATDNGELDLGRNYKEDNDYYYGVPPGYYPPNPLGLYDMAGNKPEWVLDWWYDYTEESQINPVNNIEDFNKVVRGFTGYGSGSIYTLYGRGYRPPDNTGTGISLRCVCNQQIPIE
jgi:formylglycine-generating enzyme required for sulfatase activity